MQNSTPSPPTKSTSGKEQERGPRARTDAALAKLREVSAWAHGKFGPSRSTSQMVLNRLAQESHLLRAMEALHERPDSEHDGGCSAGFSKLPCKCSQKDRGEALTALADAILGPEEASAGG